MAGLSPMMTQYLETKKQYPDCVVFYRLGDFYEMFFEDALLVAKELELTLTGKDCGLPERAPMCGVPHHALDPYLSRLVQKGYKVAIAEQMEDPKLAKGIVKREVVRIVTPGTLMSETALEADRNHYLMGIAYLGDSFGIAGADISTGDFFVTEVSSQSMLRDAINQYGPAEIVCNAAFTMSGADIDGLRRNQGITVSVLDNSYFSEDASKEILRSHFGRREISGLELNRYPSGFLSAGAVLRYLYDTQKSNCPQLQSIKPYQSGEYMMIDAGTARNLELVETMREKKKRGSLLGVLDKTSTAMGARLLRSYLEAPLLDREAILCRQDAVEALFARYIDREELKEYLQTIYDLERLMGRISSGSANTRDLLSFSSSLSVLPGIRLLLAGFPEELLAEIYGEMDELEDIRSLIAASIREDAPLSLREGDIIRDGFHDEIDRLRAAKREGKNWLSALEERERAGSEIKNLKIKFNKVFGYYFEVTNSFKDKVPSHFIRKQTLTNAERYTTPELKEIESAVLGAEERLGVLEYDCFTKIREQISREVGRIQKTARQIARLDVFVSLAEAASRNQYVRPKINTNGYIEIKGGRHPVVEKMLGNNQFVKNDTCLDGKEHRISIITGPNMAGKSTYMRQTALIVLMAQMGSFVPASGADISVCDRIFTRVGASDDLASGQSTFMVEMTEVANILHNATKNSLLILDEIGRGTSTYDGLSIAWAVVEHIADEKKLGAKALFATHYHELTELEGSLFGVHNYCISVKENGDDIVFLRKIVRGGADKSYGIQVARLAGVPESVLVRAKELSMELLNADIALRGKGIKPDISRGRESVKKSSRPSDMGGRQISLFEAFSYEDIIEELKTLNLEDMRIGEAVSVLERLQRKILNRI